MGRRAVTHCPRLPCSPGTAIESQHVGAQRNRYSGLTAVLAGAPTAAQAVTENRTARLANIARHQQKANEQCWKTKTWGAGSIHPASCAGCSSVTHAQQRAVPRGERQHTATFLLAAGTHDPCPNWRASKGTGQLLPIPRRHR